jgi:hypothetical protein
MADEMETDDESDSEEESYDTLSWKTIRKTVSIDTIIVESKTVVNL